MPNKSISFNEEMIKAILDGRKTQTRRPHAESKYKDGEVVQISNTGFYLQIISVKKEKLQDIAEQDAIAEGIEQIAKQLTEYLNYGVNMYKDYPKESCWTTSAKSSFRSLWNYIYKDDTSKQWHKNPWVWVYEFERI